MVQKYFPKSCCIGKIILGDNGGDRKKMYVTSIISGTEIFLDNYQKLDNLFKLILCV